MSKFSKNIAPYVENELAKANEAEQKGDYLSAFKYLENAHVLGQASTYWHVKVHYLMMRWGVRQKDFNDVVGQIIRIIGSAVLTKIKGVPVGNTGGSDVSPVKVMPIKAKHAEIIAKAHLGA